MNKAVQSISIALLAVLASCGPSGNSAGGPATPKVKVTSNSAGSAADLMPISPGNVWTYQVNATARDAKGQSTSGVGENTLKVISVRDTPAGKEANIGVFTKQSQGSSVAFVVNEKGVYQSRVKGPGVDAAYTPPLPMILWNMKPGETAKWTGTGYMAGANKVGPISCVVTYKGEMEVDTLAGRMKAMRVDNLQTYTVGGKEMATSQSMWFVPKIGIVRSIDILATPAGARQSLLNLKSYTVK